MIHLQTAHNQPVDEIKTERAESRRERKHDREDATHTSKRKEERTFEELCVNV